MDELESAVLLCLNPTAQPNLRERALQYCQNLRQSPDGWAFVLQRLSTAMRPEAAFWCLQVIQETLSDSSRYPVSFTNDQVAGIRAKVLEYFSKVVFRERLSNGGTNTSQQPVAGNFEPPSFLLNKLAQVVVTLIAADYPQNWPDAFQGTVLPLASLVQGNEFSASMFFRILRSLDEDVTSIRATQVSEQARKTSIRVKDAIRDDCVVALVTRCAELLSSSKFMPHSFDFISRYVEWVDIGLIVRENIISPVYVSITSVAATSARPAAAAALRAILTKRMDPTAKISLMNSLRIAELLQSIPVNQICSEDEEQGDPELSHQSGQEEVAALVNTSVIVALEILKETMKENYVSDNASDVRTSAASIAQVALPVALRFLGEHADEGTSSQTLQCVTTYVNVFSRASRKNQDGSIGEGMGAMIDILKVVEERALFSPDFDPKDDSSEQQRSFFELRRILLKRIFASVVRIFPGMGLEFVSSLFAKAAASVDIPRTELALAMLVSLIVTSPDTPELKELRTNAIANPPACMEFSSDVTTSSMDKIQIAQKHQLEVVSNTYFDLVARSYRLFLTRSNPALLSTVLSVFVDRRGLGHPSSEAVRSQAAYCLLKLTRPLRSIIAGSHLDAILTTVQAYMFPLHSDASAQSSRDQMMIFETVGYLLGSDHKKDSSMRYLTAALQSLVEGLRTSTAKGPLPVIKAAGFLSKGFGGDSKPLLLINETRLQHDVEQNGMPRGGSPDRLGKDVKVQRVTPLSHDMQAIWVSCLEAVLKAASSCFGQDQDGSLLELRAMLLFFLHRMVDTIGVAVLPYLERSLPNLLSSSSSAVDLRDAIILASQAVTKFGAGSEGLAMQVYAPIVQHAHQHSFSVDPSTLMAISEESREAVEMHRAYTYFMHAIVGTRLIGILLHPNHLGLMQGVMTSLLSSAVGASLDLRVSGSVMKMSLHILLQMVEQWTGAVSGDRGSSGPAGFKEFALKEVSNATIMSGVQGCIFRGGDYESGEALSVLTEIVALQRKCASHLGPAFGEALQSGPLAALSKSDVEAYLSGLYSANLTPVANQVSMLASMCKVLRRKG